MQYLVRVLAEFWPRYRCFQISEGSRDNIIPLPLSSWYSTRSGAVMTSLQIYKHSIHVTGSVQLPPELQKSIIMSGDETIHKRDGGDEFEEDGDDEQAQVLYIQRSFRKHLRFSRHKHWTYLYTLGRQSSWYETILDLRSLHAD